MFELADEQFVSIREKRNAVVERSVAAVRDKEPGLRVDAPVLIEFMNSSEQFRTIRAQMADTESLQFDEDTDANGNPVPDNQFVGIVVEALERIGIATVDELTEMTGIGASALRPKTAW